MAYFSLDDAQARYGGKTILRNLNLTIERGERVAILGRSGVGKTSLLNLLYRQHAEEIALVPQDFGLVRSLTVFHNIYMGQLSRHRLPYNFLNLIHPVAREVALAKRVTDRLGLTEKLFDRVGELSGGQRQRVAIGRAFYFNGPTIIADEPVSALDGARSREILKLITDQHKTVILAMHDIPLALDQVDRVVGIADGQIVLDAKTTGLNRSSLYDLGLVDD